MPLNPQAFLNFKEFINVCKSHGLILWGGGAVVYGFEQNFNSSNSTAQPATAEVSPALIRSARP
jgi:hypothetical protein